MITVANHINSRYWFWMYTIVKSHLTSITLSFLPLVQL